MDVYYADIRVLSVAASRAASYMEHATSFTGGGDCSVQIYSKFSSVCSSFLARTSFALRVDRRHHKQKCLAFIVLAGA